MLDFSGESKKNKRFFIFFVKKEPFLSAPKGMGFPGLKFIMKIFTQQELHELLKFAQEQNDTVLTAAALNALADCNDASDFII